MLNQNDEVLTGTDNNAGSDKLTTRQKESAIKQYFKDAFCAERIDVLLSEDIEFKVDGILKITCSDKRGVFYLAKLESVKE